MAERGKFGTGIRTDPRFKNTVAGLSKVELPTALREAVTELEKKFPGAGVILFVADFGHTGGLGYISSINREDSRAVVKEWLEKS